MEACAAAGIDPLIARGCEAHHPSLGERFAEPPPQQGPTPLAAMGHLALVDLPDAATPGPGEMRVRLHGSSLNYHDYGVCSRPGWKAHGRIPMSDGAGVVDAVGEGVTEFAPGDLVVSCFFPTWSDGPARHRRRTGA